jgi:hypothetical protein
VGAVGVWAISVHRQVIWQFALSSASRDGLDTFVGASPRRGTDIRHVAGEEWVPLRSVHFCRGDECKHDGTRIDHEECHRGGMARDDPASTVSTDKGHRLQPSGS